MCRCVIMMRTQLWKKVYRIQGVSNRKKLARFKNSPKQSAFFGGNATGPTNTRLSLSGNRDQGVHCISFVCFWRLLTDTQKRTLLANPGPTRDGPRKLKHPMRNKSEAATYKTPRQANHMLCTNYLASYQVFLFQSSKQINHLAQNKSLKTASITKATTHEKKEEKRHEQNDHYIF